ncbi:MULTISPECIES: hypothetical protein [Mycobacteriaceae]|uniref:Uncharacterized protein n=1 Tax=Mycolicibacterium neoaurum VKM Ac-1815D TaxID=700508 RepID=V5XJR7_MYCNE|nr:MULTISPECIES: hypothetical protein [Mycobacteriaceae]AHC28024.1 hypothetical protein D174_19430 [Mycolicibacterium neoaurum VKM Ac-1815D]AMO06928.1 hypothetical protein MyAD_19060 [Mycolicibacterium neoaurum]AXK74709.1 hypothetical protein DXK33_05880 [Mycolicibacterium neoaurum]KJQ48104.1 hypothetical protein TS71_23050 [Mycolicibacterium neoaurum]KUM06139.1 hypothetical protein AVZ31_22920 [Mycolicibacterium neoaurum]
MPHDPQALTHADFQRAATLIKFAAEIDRAGINFVFNEAGRENRSAQLLLATIDGYRVITRELRSESALPAVDEMIRGAVTTAPDPDMRLAAAAVVARADSDTDALNAVMIKANKSGRPAELVAALMGMYATLLPELVTDHCTANLATWPARIAGHSGGA